MTGERLRRRKGLAYCRTPSGSSPPSRTPYRVTRAGTPQIQTCVPKHSPDRRPCWKRLRQMRPACWASSWKPAHRRPACAGGDRRRSEGILGVSHRWASHRRCRRRLRLAARRTEDGRGCMRGYCSRGSGSRWNALGLAVEPFGLAGDRGEEEENMAVALAGLPDCPDFVSRWSSLCCSSF